LHAAARIHALDGPEDVAKNRFARVGERAREAFDEGQFTGRAWVAAAVALVGCAWAAVSGNRPTVAAPASAQRPRRKATTPDFKPAGFNLFM
jgi:hypothetical protein